MKNMKKCFSILLALVMVFALAATAMAADTPTEGGDPTPISPVTPVSKFSITITNDAEGHEYEAYQIFTGDLSTQPGATAGSDPVKVLSNVKWGANSTLTAGNVVDENILKNLTLEQAKGYVNFNSTPVGSTNVLTDGKYVIADLPAGYYLVKDKDGSLAGDDDSYTNFIIQVVANVTTNPKSDKPEVEKKVQDIVDTNDDDIANNSWEDSADHDIGDMVPFQITGTLPDNYSTYTKYSYKFTDTMDPGLTYQNDAKVYVVKGNNKTDVTSSFTITPTGTTNGDGTLEISISDLKTLKDSNNAEIVDKDCTIVVEYTAQLNSNAVHGSTGNKNKVKLTYSNNPNHEGDGDETGETPEDIVIVFTYKTIVNKVDEEKKPLTGAEFTLEKFVNVAWVSKQVVKSGSGSEFTISGLDDGRYRLVESKTPVGYNTIDPVYFVIRAEHTQDNATPPRELKTLNAYVTDANGIVKTEIKEGATTATQIDFGTVTVSSGEIETDVENKSGSTLPETGGMGTTILYIAGGVLVAAAAVMLIVKRRMAMEK